MYFETVDGSLKEQTIDIDSNHCCGRGYAAHCLRTYGASKNTSAQHKRHGETCPSLGVLKTVVAATGACHGSG